MLLTPQKALWLIVALWALFGLVWYSIDDHSRQVRKSMHRRKMRGKLTIIEGGKAYGTKK